ncbi:hypothetical protein QTP86_007181 [Hemibagrus guttatus]|nr:hypothetical protein QTP86_007181 [Hemibagrus guttatus]
MTSTTADEKSTIFPPAVLIVEWSGVEQLGAKKHLEEKQLNCVYKPWADVEEHFCYGKYGGQEWAERYPMRVETPGAMTSYIGKCIDDETASKSITTRPNQKPWMTTKVRVLLKSRDSAFRAGDKDALRTARAKLSRAISEAKRAHTQSMATSRAAVTLSTCGKASSPSPTTGQLHLPVTLMPPFQMR